MSTHHGKDGLVKVGGSPSLIAETREWTISQTGETADDSVQGDTWRTHKPGLKSWTGSCNCFWDETDTNGQATLLPGASVDIKFYPEGADANDTFYSGNVTVTGVEISASVDNIVEANFTFQGNGALATSTVSA